MVNRDLPNSPTSSSFSLDLNSLPFSEGALNLDPNPLTAFDQWFEEVSKTNNPDVTAMTLATSSKDGRPGARTVLFKGFQEHPDGRKAFRFFTNYASQKSHDLSENPVAALLFYWPVVRRQVRIEGRVAKLDRQESEIYFQSRPRGSQLGAWASPQSQPVEGRDELERRLKEFDIKFAGLDKLPLPPEWGGWYLLPDRMEFWEERPNRFHERRLYVWTGSGWTIQTLAP